MRHPAQAPTGSGHAAGFTLLEALCVLAIIVLIMGLAVPALRRVPDGPRLEAATRLLAASLRLARSDAIACNCDVTVAIDVEGRIVKPSNRAATDLPAELNIRMKAAKLVRSAEQAGAFRFFPDGTSSGGDIDLSLHARSARIWVNWLDGEARLDLAPGGHSSDDRLGAEQVSYRP